MSPLTKAMSAIPHAVDDAQLYKNDPREISSKRQHGEPQRCKDRANKNNEVKNCRTHRFIRLHNSHQTIQIH